MDASELEGSDLDAAVAMACGPETDSPAWLVLARMRTRGEPWQSLWESPTLRFRPSSDWRHGGPIIERERISIKFDDADGQWYAVVHVAHEHGVRRSFANGPTLLIAAMRAFVISKAQHHGL